MWEVRCIHISGSYEKDIARFNEILAEGGWEPYAVAASLHWLRRRKIENTGR